MKRIAVVIVCAGLAGCEAVPGAGPLASDINAQAGKSLTETQRAHGVVFDVVDVDSTAARTVAEFSTGMLKRRFGLGGAATRPVIGVGDRLRITIFEAGADGLFSTSDSKQTNIEVVVQPDGKAAIPYVGMVTFAGRTLEEARQAVLGSLANKAVEPDVIVNALESSSRTVAVAGAVGHPSVVPLGLTAEKISEVIARAGGPEAEPYESYVTLVRGQRTGSVLLQTLLDNPSENIYVEPKDQIFVSRDPRTFTVLGEVWKNGRIPFGANEVNLLEAIALAGGGADARADARGYFVFRYEEPEIVSDLLSAERFHDLVAKGMKPNKDGKYPIVYRFDMSVADSLIIGQTFPIKNRDVIYASRHPSVDFVKFMTMIRQPVGIADDAVGIARGIQLLQE
ncbi:polysaccharide export protein [Ciceribacter sp. L1K23]|uniref:polysaccharide biosynthesis/export family protein n=1 Tax=unclassified Ciceribacter TaxID=2628820 RepID=UPI001ABE5B9E|nr:MULTISPECIES: polysaccharide biosynthesis/export family protein [unclassified Ciceribacter]MBO3762516.1 polysaccharide export protein [Ciceribacter sp. L1K22]MBR0554127.1 polysaccharide export protein [Ciceribacter sp. L1K23]